MRIRALPTLLFVALCLTGGAASGGSKTEPATVRTPPTFFVSGHGWGHGLGMSQYGAYGYAQHGWTYDRIIKHYYTGTTIGQAPIGRVRVLLADKANQVHDRLERPASRSSTVRAKHALDAGNYAVGPGFKVADPAAPQTKAQALGYPLEFRAWQRPRSASTAAPTGGRCRS